jgi:hypothetical protein
MMAAYAEEFLERRDNSGQWHTRLAIAQGTPGMHADSEWLFACLNNAVVIFAAVFAWLHDASVPRGELMAGIVSGCAVVFVFHSLSQAAELQRTNYGAIWRQTGRGLHEVGKEHHTGSR